MIITRLKLKNYRRYRDIDIEFPTGPIGIVGRNGIGKSTLLEAIGWCMYGGKGRTTQDEIKTTDVDDECFVILEMSCFSMYTSYSLLMSPIVVMVCILPPSSDIMFILGS